MIRYSRLCMVSISILLVSGVSVAAESRDEKGEWIRVSTENFVLLSNAGKRRAARIGKKLEQLREVLDETSKGMTLHSPLPTTIYVFKDTQTFAPYNLDENGKPSDALGYFIRAFDGNYAAIDASAETLPFAVIYHEYLHYVLENSIPAIPLWLNEGIAEFYRTFQIRGGRAEIGLSVPEHLWWLSNHAWMSLDALFAVDTASPDYNEGERQGTFYAQSWLLTHQLLVNPEYRERMGPFLSLLKRGVPSAEAFTSAFHTDLDAVLEKLVEHLSAGFDAFYRYTPEKEFDEHSAEVTPLDQRDVLYHLGDLLAHSGPIQFDAAERHLRQALEIDDKFVDAYAGLAALRLSQERPAEARELCVRALSLSPNHGRTLVLHGVSLMEQYRSSIDEDTPRPEKTPPLLLQAREQFRKRLERAPDHMEALAGLGQTYLFEREELRPGIDALVRVSRAWPARTDILANLIVLTVRTGNIEGARSLLDRGLRPRGDADVTRWVETEIAEYRMLRAQELLVAGEVDRALKLAQEATKDVSDAATLRRITDWIAVVSSGHETEAADSRMQRAQELLRDGQVDRALELAQEVADDVTDPAIRRRVIEWIGSVSSAHQAESLRKQALEAGEAGDAERARELLEQVAATVGHGDDATTVQDAYNRAIALANAGEYEKASELLEQIAETASQPNVRLQAANLAKEVRERAAYNRSVDLYNQAVTALNEGKHDEAESLLTQLLEDAPGGDLQAQAERVLRELRRLKEP